MNTSMSPGTAPSTPSTAAGTPSTLTPEELTRTFPAFAAAIAKPDPDALWRLYLVERQWRLQAELQRDAYLHQVKLLAAAHRRLSTPIQPATEAWSSSSPSSQPSPSKTKGPKAPEANHVVAKATRVVASTPAKTSRNLSLEDLGL